MSNNQPPRVLFNFEPELQEENIDESIDELVDPETGETNPNFVYELPQVVEREEINEDTIFDIEKKVQPLLEPPSVPTKVKKARKPMSADHKAKLAFAREKALATRRANAEERKKMKDVEKETKVLKNKKKVAKKK